ncbi:MAG TPA: hypothetical protein VNJ01_07900 [Bacteriovoracaceae bacterium]|nr:hypothetical protein [Bacteriovoracaceae bacterium]
MKIIFLTLAVVSFSTSAADFGYLKPGDQKYYKNDSMEGNNKQERIDSLVKEINKLYGEVAALRAEMQNLKSEVEGLKKSK